MKRKGKFQKRLIHRASVHPMRLIALSFAVIILVGAVLLTLPAASSNGQSCGFRPALFTATSATCVTGLVLFDTGTQWSAFGRVVIICLIEIGGLGFISIASLILFLFRRKVGLRQRMVIAQAFSLEDMEDAVKLQKVVIFGSLGVEFLGAAVLFFRFLKPFGALQAAKYGLFHAISAYCNAGFDIFGNGDSVAAFQSDGVVCITLMALIVIGGIGFFVWEELLRVKRLKKCSVYSKLVLMTTAGLILAGAGLTALLEWNNPGTLGNMPVGTKILNSFFQSVTLRTAGFASFDQSLLTPAGKAVSVVFMLIGGSSGSTAGGVKTVTFIVLMLFMASKARGKQSVTVFRRTIPDEKVMDAMTIVTIVVSLAVLGGIVICATSPVDFTDALFEAVSALATVGLTAGATGKLSVIAQLLIILFMYFGRVGVLTLSLGFLMGDRAAERYRYASTNILIG